MVDAINANTLTGVNGTSTQIKIQNTQEVQEKESEASTQGDTVSISKQGQAMAKTFQAGSAYVSSGDKGYTDSNAMAIKSAAASAGVNANTQVANENSQMSAAVSGGSGASASSSSTSSTSDLSSYTAQELKEMLEDGEITQAEYDAEIESRNSSSSTSSETEATNQTAAAQQTAVENFNIGSTEA